MRITTSTVEDFLTNVKDQLVFRGVIYYNMVRNKIPNSNSFEVYYQLSTILVWEDANALLICGVNCGVDRQSSDKSVEGTTRMADYHTQMKNYVDRCNQGLSEGGSRLMLLPGVIDS